MAPHRQPPVSGVGIGSSSLGKAKDPIISSAGPKFSMNPCRPSLSDRNGFFKRGAMKSATANPAPEDRRRYISRRSARPSGPRVQVTFKGEVLADSRDALRLDEPTYSAVY